MSGSHTDISRLRINPWNLSGAGAGGGRGPWCGAHLEDGHGLREVMLLHGRSGVESCQRVIEFLQVAVTEAPVVQVVTQTRD